MKTKQIFETRARPAWPVRSSGVALHVSSLQKKGGEKIMAAKKKAAKKAAPKKAAKKAAPKKKAAAKKRA